MTYMTGDIPVIWRHFLLDISHIFYAKRVGQMCVRGSRDKYIKHVSGNCNNDFYDLYHRKNSLYYRYPIKRLAVPFKNPLRCINDTRYIHVAVARLHTDVDSYERYCWDGTAWISVRKRVFHVFIPLQ